MPTSRHLIASLLTAIVLAQPVAVAPARAQETIDHVVLDVDAYYAHAVRVRNVQGGGAVAATDVQV